MSETGAIILAAGSSLRMGQPKQLMLRGGKPLLLHTVHAAVQAGADPVLVVTGAYGEKVNAALRHEPVRMIRNDRFPEGMGTSIAAGFREAAADPLLDCVFLLLCDQPAVDAPLLRKMRRRAASGEDGLVVCGYAGTVGPPLLISRPFFRAFAGTSPGSGAKDILLRHRKQLNVVEFEEGAIDLDKPSDLDRFS